MVRDDDPLDKRSSIKEEVLEGRVPFECGIGILCGLALLAGDRRPSEERLVGIA